MQSVIVLFFFRVSVLAAVFAAGPSKETGASSVVVSLIAISMMKV
jgi:hypothetical protein